MPERKYIRACQNGHVINVFDRPNSNAVNFGDGSNPSIHLAGPNYCQECGTETIVSCTDCGSSISIVAETESHSLKGDGITSEIAPVEKDDLPSYCPNCGTAFPWLTPVEQETVRDGVFLDLDPSEVSGYFYQELVNEINKCYKTKANNATNILYRKLLENLVYDILLFRFGPKRIELYYDTNNGRLGFKELVENLKDNKSELKQFSSAIGDPDTIRRIWQFKQHGDSSAHSKENLVTDDEIEEKTKEATQVAKILLELRENIRTASD